MGERRLGWVALLLVGALFAGVPAQAQVGATFQVQFTSPGLVFQDTEPNLAIEFTVDVISLGVGSGGDGTVTWTLTPVTATGPPSPTQDYPSASGTFPVTFSLGTTIPTTFDVPIGDDLLDEAAEDFLLTLTCAAPCQVGANDEATGRILDDDAAPTISVSGPSGPFVEGNAGATAAPTYTVSLSAASGQTVTADIAAAGTGAFPATLTSDFENIAQAVVLPPGTTSVGISLDIYGDTIDENDEGFRVTLSNLVNAASGTLSQSATIQDDDTADLVIGDVARTEGTTPWIVPVTAVGGLQRSINIVCQVFIGGTDTATNSDITPVANQARTITGTGTEGCLAGVVDDLFAEGPETFTATFTAAGESITDGTATGTIQASDTPALIVNGGFPFVNVAENASLAGATQDYTVALSTALDSGETVVVCATENNNPDQVTVNGGTDDCVTFNGPRSANTPLSFTAGAVDDTTFETFLHDGHIRHTVNTALTSSAYDGLCTPSCTTVQASITDDDLPTYSIEPTGLDPTEGTSPGAGGSATFLVQRTGVDCAIVTAHNLVLDRDVLGSAVPGLDYTATVDGVPDDVTDNIIIVPFGAGCNAVDHSEAFVTFTATPDSLDEDDEPEAWTIRQTGTYHRADGLESGAFSILDDDDTTLQLTVETGETVEAGAPLAFLVTRLNSDCATQLDLVEDADFELDPTFSTASRGELDILAEGFEDDGAPCDARILVHGLEDYTSESPDEVAIGLLGDQPGSYVVDPLASLASGTIYDIDVPIIDVTVTDDDVDEGTSPAAGGTLEFTLAIRETANPGAGEAGSDCSEVFDVTYSISPTPDPGEHTVVESDGVTDGVFTTSGAACDPLGRIVGTVEVVANPDSLNEEDAVFQVVIPLTFDEPFTHTGGYAAGISDPGQLSDDDAPRVGVVASAPSATEGDTVTFTLTRTNTAVGAPAPTTVAFTLTGSALGSAAPSTLDDYDCTGAAIAPQTFQVTIPSSPATATVTCTIRGAGLLSDGGLDEADEWLNLTVINYPGDATPDYNPAIAPQSPLASVLILDEATDLPVLALTGTDDADEAGSGAIQWTLTRTNTDSQATWDIDASAFFTGTADEGADLEPVPGGLVFRFAEGASTATLDATAFDDTLDEREPETLTLTLPASAEYVIRPPQATHGVATTRIHDDDLPQVGVQPVPADGAFDEDGNPAIVLEFRLDDTTADGDAATTDCQNEVTATFQLGPGTASVAQGTLPLDPDDFDVPSFQVTFPGGGTCSPQYATLTGLVDGLHEGDETVLVELVDGTLYDLDAANDAALTLRDADAPPTVSVTASDGGTFIEADEAGDEGSILVTVSLDALSAFPTTVELDVNASLSWSPLAVQDDDYRVVGSLTLSFAPGETERTVRLFAIDDELRESRYETIRLDVDFAASAGIQPAGSDTGITLSLEDDDQPGFRLRGAPEPIATSESQSAEPLPYTEVELFLKTLPEQPVQFNVTLDPELSGEVRFLDDSGPFCTLASAQRLQCTVDGTKPKAQPIFVHLQGIDDDAVDGDSYDRAFGAKQMRVIVSGLAAGSDYYQESESFAVNNLDNDVADLQVTPASGIELTEGDSPAILQVRLGDKPLREVVVTVTPAGPLQVDATQLTFDPADWPEVKALQVSYPDDDVVWGNGTFDVVFQARMDFNATIEAPTYDGLGASVSIATIDDEVPAFLLAGVPASLLESAGPATATVRLASAPAGDVVVALTADDGLVVSDQITFGPANFSTPRPFTIQAEQNELLDGPRVLQLHVRVVPNGVANGYLLAYEDRAIQVTDDDVAGLILDTHNLEVTEGAPAGSPGAAQLTVRLLGGLAGPADRVVVQLLANTSRVTVSPATLTFTASGPEAWDQPQLVTVTAAADQVDQGVTTPFRIDLATVDASSLDAYDLVGDLVEGTIVDANQAGLSLGLAPGNAPIVAEGSSPGDGSVDVVLTLATAPTSPIEVTVSGTGLLATPATPIAFGPGLPLSQTVTITAPQDTDLEDEATQLRAFVSTGSNEYTTLEAPPLLLTVNDDDVARLVLVPVAGTTVGEANTTGLQLTLRLSNNPGGKVTVDLTSLNPGAATVSPSRVEIDAGDWSADHLVVVHGVPDGTDAGDRAALIRAAVDASPGATEAVRYRIASAQDVLVTITDGDLVADVTLAIPASAREGDTVPVGLHLDDAVAGRVTVALAFSGSASTADYFVSTPTVTFEPGEQDKSVDLLLRTDYRNEGSETLVVQVASVTGGREVGTQQATLLVEDEPVPEVRLFTPTPTLAEAGTMLLHVDLTMASPEDVQVTLAFSGTAEPVRDFVASQLTVTLPAGTTHHELPITVVSDALDEDDEAIRVTATADKADATRALATATIVDDDAMPTLRLEASPATITEGGVTGTIRFLLSAPSGRTVSVEFQLDGTATPGTDYTASQGLSITIPTGAAGASLVVEALTDSIHEAPETIVVKPTSSTTATVPSALLSTTTIRNADKHLIVPTATGGSTRVSEAVGPDHTDIVQVAWAEDPQGTVLVDVTTADPSEFLVEPALLSFTTDTWQQPQLVTVTGVDDTEDDGDVVANLVFTVREAGSSAIGLSSAPSRLPVTVVDDDVAPVVDVPDVPVVEELPKDFDITDQLGLDAGVVGATLSWTAKTDARGYQVWRQDGDAWVLVTRRLDAGGLDLKAEPGDRYKLTYYASIGTATGFARDGAEAAQLDGWDPSLYVEMPGVAGPGKETDTPTVPGPEEGPLGKIPWAWVLPVLLALLIVALLVMYLMLRSDRERKAGAEPLPAEYRGTVGGVPAAAGPLNPRPSRRWLMENLVPAKAKAPVDAPTKPERELDTVTTPHQTFWVVPDEPGLPPQLIEVEETGLPGRPLVPAEAPSRTPQATGLGPSTGVAANPAVPPGNQEKR